MRLSRFLAPIALGAALAAAPAAAQVNGIASSNTDLVFASSQALQNGYSQINQSYEPQRQQVSQLREQQRTLLRSVDTNGDGQLTPEEAQGNPGLEQQVNSIQQQIEAAARPIQLAQLYVVEQLIPQYQQAQNQVVQQKGIQVMLAPEAFQYAPQNVNVTADLVTALNTLAPSVQIAPPANFQPSRGALEMHQAVASIIVASQQQAALQQQQAQPPSGR